MAEKHGTKVADILNGRYGESNTLWGHAGDDAITGTDLNDVLFGGSGNDNMVGGRLDDLLFGDSGNDVLRGTEGDDDIFGGDGNDKLLGGKGNDALAGGKGDDTLEGHSGDDALLGGSGNDILLGQTGNDLLYGGAGNDVINAGSGDDAVVVSSGQDSHFGGAGYDEIDFSQIVGRVTVDLSKNSASIAFGKTLVVDSVQGFESVVASDAGTRFTGSRGDNKFVGGNGDDYVRGLGGNDLLFGGNGKDVFAYGLKDVAGGAVDRIADFETANDRLDLKEFMKGAASTADAVRFVDAGMSTIVQGHAKSGWVDVVILEGIASNDVGFEILT